MAHPLTCFKGIIAEVVWDDYDKHRARALSKADAILEEMAKVADAEAQRCRDRISECANWSPAQGEWSRARDTALNIADALRAGKGEL